MIEGGEDRESALHRLNPIAVWPLPSDGDFHSPVPHGGLSYCNAVRAKKPGQEFRRNGIAHADGPWDSGADTAASR
jgi:hypothetical protein